MGQRQTGVRTGVFILPASLSKRLVIDSQTFKSNEIKFIVQQRAKSHLRVAKTMIETINILGIFIIRTERKR